MTCALVCYLRVACCDDGENLTFQVLSALSGLDVVVERCESVDVVIGGVGLP